MKRRAALLGGSLLALAQLAAAQSILSSRAAPSPLDVAQYLDTGQCAKAVRALEPMLEQRSAEALMLAGWLSERGHCLERSQEKAWTYYELAFRQGQRSVALRLASLAATPEGGADVAAVLWWGRQLSGTEGGSRGSECDPLPGQPQADETTFVEALGAWPQARLAACRARVGFLSMVKADVHYPFQAIRMSVDGSVRLEFRLHERWLQVTPGGRAGDELLAEHVRSAAQAAMARVPAPSVPVHGVVEFVFRAE